MRQVRGEEAGLLLLKRNPPSCCADPVSVLNELPTIRPVTCKEASLVAALHDCKQTVRSPSPAPSPNSALFLVSALGESYIACHRPPDTPKPRATFLAVLVQMVQAKRRIRSDTEGSDWLRSLPRRRRAESRGCSSTERTFSFPLTPHPPAASRLPHSLLSRWRDDPRRNPKLRLSPLSLSTNRLSVSPAVAPPNTRSIRGAPLLPPAMANTDPFAPSRSFMSLSALVSCPLLLPARAPS